MERFEHAAARLDDDREMARRGDIRQTRRALGQRMGNAFAASAIQGT